MRKSSFSVAQTLRILKETETGNSVREICRERGISNTTFYRRQSLYGGMEGSELARLKELEQENRRLKQMFAVKSPENKILKEVIEKKALEPREKRELVDSVKESLGARIRIACRALCLSRTAYRYHPDPTKDDPVIEVLLVLAGWAEQHGVRLEFIRPGRRMQNGFIERFNRTCRTKVLDMFVFKRLKRGARDHGEWGGRV